MTPVNTSSHGVGARAEVRCAAEESSTNGSPSWYATSGSSRIIGSNRPIARISMPGYSFTFTGWTPATRHRSPTASRWVRGGLLGTCQGRPQARNVVGRGPRVQGVRTLHYPDAAPGEKSRYDAVTQVALRSTYDVVRSAHLGGAHPAGVMGGEGISPHLDAGECFRALGGQWKALRHRARDRTVAVEVADGDQNRVRALGGREQCLGDGRPVGRPAVIGGIGAVVDRDGAGG